MKKNIIFSTLSIIALWLVWIIAYFIVRNDCVLPSFWGTFAEMGKYLASGTFWVAFGKTFLRAFLAFMFSLVFGIALAVLARTFSSLRAFLAPLVSILRTVPTMAFILILLLVSTPSFAPVIVSAFVLFPAVYASALASLDEVEAEYGELIRAFRVDWKRKIFKMYLPLSAPPMLKQSGAIFSMGLKVTVSGEVLANAYRSIGGLMQDVKLSSMPNSMAQLIALTLITVLLGFLLEGACVLAYKLIVRWRA